MFKNDWDDNTSDVFVKFYYCKDELLQCFHANMSYLEIWSTEESDGKSVYVR